MKGFLIGIFVMFCGTAFAGNGGVVSSINSTIDYKSSTSGDDLNVDAAYIAGWYSTTDGYFYAQTEAYQDIFIDQDGDTVAYQSQRLLIEEIYAKLYIKNVELRLGKVHIPFGISHLSRPQTSVFISVPRKDFYDLGLNFSYDYGIITSDIAYMGNGDYSVRAIVSLFGGLNKVSVSTTNIPDVEKAYGNWSITNVFKYGSVFFDSSILMDYTPDNGDFWARTVLAPGMFDIVGVFGGYYHMKDMEYVVVSTEDKNDSWSYGFFVDVSPNMSMSFEWMNSLALNPVTAQITIKF